MKIAILDFFQNIYFDNPFYKYLIFLCIIGAGILVARTLYWLIQKFIKVFTKKTKTNLDHLIVDMVEEPAVVYLVLFIIRYGWETLSFPNFPKIPLYFENFYYTVLVLNTAWLISRLINALIENYVKPLTKKSKTDLDDTLLPILSKVINIIAFVTGLIMILDHFGQEIGPMLAGLGIGGLAFALAAKDLLSNIFGSLTVIFDKPFVIGDRIKINGYDGKVKEISLRTTKIETLEGRLVYIPNAKFTDNAVENITQEWARKVLMNIGLVYDTNVAQMKKAKEIITKLLSNQEGVDKEKIMVYFTEFGDFAKNLMVIYWIIDKDNIFPIRDEINLQLMEKLEGAGISMAFPTQTIELKK